MSSSVIFSTAHHTCPTLFILVLTLLASGIVELVLSIDDPLSPAQCVEGQLGPSELVVPGSHTPKSIRVNPAPPAHPAAAAPHDSMSIEARLPLHQRVVIPPILAWRRNRGRLRALATLCARMSTHWFSVLGDLQSLDKYGTITRSYCVRRFIRSEEGCYWTEDPRHWRYDCDHIRVHRRGELAPGGEVIATEDPIYGQAQEQAHQETGVRGVPAHIRTGARIHVQVEEPEVRDDPGPKSDEDDFE
ncbi:hypothetical protein PSTT_02319 [Puccinia striiformis]|uniref:HNH nuclease domain-containing protein n=1 Tax=Puccinia striiformis TaxID=27350 RepID=A0A2S4W0M7_9BASI|nr:hypothetical protein PSTT_02319 [Puccinia striiformis]